MTRRNKLTLITTFLLALTILACSSTKNVSNSTSARHDGSTKENAIVVKSISAEYEWIKANYPGSKLISQALIDDNKKQYDILTFVTATGETKKAYFDISSFFGKF